MIVRVVAALALAAWAVHLLIGGPATLESHRQDQLSVQTP